MDRKFLAATAVLIPALALVSCSDPATQSGSEAETTTETELTSPHA